MKPIDMLMLGPTREAIKNERGWLVMIIPHQIWNLPPATLQLTEDQYVRYLDWQLRNGLIQECLPDLSPAECEILLTGIGDQQFKDICKEDEE